MVNVTQDLHRVVLRNVDEINNTIRVLCLEIPHKGCIRVSKGSHAYVSHQLCAAALSR